MLVRVCSHYTQYFVAAQGQKVQSRKYFVLSPQMTLRLGRGLEISFESSFLASHLFVLTMANETSSVLQSSVKNMDRAYHKFLRLQEWSSQRGNCRVPQIQGKTRLPGQIYLQGWARCPNLGWIYSLPNNYPVDKYFGMVGHTQIYTLRDIAGDLSGKGDDG